MIARPMPLLAPVTSATLSMRLRSTFATLDPCAARRVPAAPTLPPALHRRRARSSGLGRSRGRAIARRCPGEAAAGSWRRVADVGGDAARAFRRRRARLPPLPELAEHALLRRGFLRRGRRAGHHALFVGHAAQQRDRARRQRLPVFVEPALAASTNSDTTLFTPAGSWGSAPGPASWMRARPRSGCAQPPR